MKVADTHLWMLFANDHQTFRVNNKNIGHDELPQLRVGKIELPRPTADDMERTLQDKQFLEHFLFMCQKPELLELLAKNKNIIDSIRPMYMDENIMKSMRDLCKEENFVKALEDLKENKEFINDVYPFIRPILDDKLLQPNLDTMKEYIEGQKRPARRLLSDEAASSSIIEKKIRDKATENYCQDLLRDGYSQGDEKEYCQQLLKGNDYEYERASHQRPVSSQYERADRRKPVIYGHTLTETIVGGGFFTLAGLAMLAGCGKFLWDQVQGRERRLALVQAFQNQAKVVQKQGIEIQELGKNNQGLEHKMEIKDLEHKAEIQELKHETETQRQSYRRENQALNQQNQALVTKLQETMKFIKENEKNLQGYMELKQRHEPSTQGHQQSNPLRKRLITGPRDDTVD